MNFLRKLNDNFEEYMCVVLFSLMTFFIFAQVLSRFLLNFSLAWTEELGRFTCVWLVYMSASAAIKRSRHIRVELIFLVLKSRAKKLMAIVSDLIWLAFSIWLVKDGIKVITMLYGHGQTSPAVQVPVWIAYSIVPLGYALMTLRILQSLYKDITAFNQPPTAEEGSE
ncbi:MAG: TRAP transporter small permease [Bacillota bacterium]